ncbi:MAG TPA: carboxypeptidase-like regulatory domain-containing protein [Candidatus Polarisedimenticolia bacterium]|nr:carboxypeptidase-like regulatory domain-containing protein [Candidatus Polarisedimenticolia bacterium]
MTGRLTDTRGVALAGATILVFPTAAGGGDGTACAQLRTDPDGGFVAFLPPGRYLVAAVKPGYDVSLTEVHSLSTRVLRMRVEPSRGGEARRNRPERDLDWILRGGRDDILRSEAPAIPPELLVAEGDRSLPPSSAPSDGRAAGEAPPARVAHATGRDLFGAVDGELVQSVGAGLLPGFSTAGDSDGERSTHLDLRAPVNERLAWDFAGTTARTEEMLDDAGSPLDGGVDRLMAGAIYQPGAEARLAGGLHTGVGRSLAGSASGTDRQLAAEGVLRPGSTDPVEIAVHTWSASIDPGDGRWLTLTAPGAGLAIEPARTGGMSLYAGSRRAFGRTDLRYGVEYLDRGTLGRGAVPRVGVRQTIEGRADLTVEGEILVDRDHPGGRVAVAGTAGQGLRMSAAVMVLPEYETVAAFGIAAPILSAPGGAGTSPVDPAAATRRAVDLSIARDFGPLSGQLAGGVGRTGARIAPEIEPGPLPLVSVGAERWYETRVGVAWRPSRTEMQFGYRRVAADDAGDPVAAGGSEYRRLDLTVAQTLPSPRALLGAELRALVAWQEVSYDAWLGAGTPASGLASRLTGGVGLSF